MLEDVAQIQKNEYCWSCANHQNLSVVWIQEAGWEIRCKPCADLLDIAYCRECGIPDDHAELGMDILCDGCERDSFSFHKPVL